MAIAAVVIVNAIYKICTYLLCMIFYKKTADLAETVH